MDSKILCIPTIFLPFCVLPPLSLLSDDIASALSSIQAYCNSCKEDAAFEVSPKGKASSRELKE